MESVTYTIYILFAYTVLDIIRKELEETVMCGNYIWMIYVKKLTCGNSSNLDLVLELVKKTVMSVDS